MRCSVVTSFLQRVGLHDVRKSGFKKTSNFSLAKTGLLNTFKDFILTENVLSFGVRLTYLDNAVWGQFTEAFICFNQPQNQGNLCIFSRFDLILPQFVTGSQTAHSQESIMVGPRAKLHTCGWIHAVSTSGVKYPKMHGCTKKHNGD